MGNQSEVRKNFGLRASNYRLSTTHGNPVDLERMVNLLQPHPGAIALDVATGGGHTAIALAKCVNKVVAIDITPEMLAEAEVASKQSDINNIVFQMQDVHNLNFSDGQFDIVVSRFAAHHFFNVKKAIREMCRVLRPGGKFYVLDCSVVDGDETEEEINRIELLRDSSHQCLYSPRQWNHVLEGLPLIIQLTVFIKENYELPQWFDRIGTNYSNRQEIFRILKNLSEASKVFYPYGDNYITTYRYEILAIKI